MSREISYEKEARASILSGVEQLEKAVKVTLGARGRNVLIQDRNNAGYHITKDGVTVAKAVELNNPLENLGCSVIKQVSKNTNDEVGDGTTTSIVLASAMIRQGIKAIDNGANPISVKRGMDKATDIVLQYLKTIAQPVADDPEFIRQIATISANGVTEIGDLIIEAFEMVGKHGAIKLDQGKGDTHYITHNKGIGFDRGMLFPGFTGSINDDAVELENPLVLVTDHMINNFGDFAINEKHEVAIFKEINELNRPLLIICEDMDIVPAAQLMESLARRSFTSVVVKAPEFGDRRTDVLGDIAAVLGARFIAKEGGISLKDVTIDDLGSCDFVRVDQNNTVITEGHGDKEGVEERVKLIKEKMKNEDAEYALAKLEERLAKLTGGIATLNLGARSEVELKEVKDRVEDALSATKAAIEEGVVAGGGVALFTAINRLQGLVLDNDDEQHGIDVIRYALQAPMENILRNAGADVEKIVETLSGAATNKMGYDVAKQEFVDMFESGIIDPYKVTKKAFENSSSISSTLLTTECVIYNSDREDEGEIIPKFH